MSQVTIYHDADVTVSVLPGPPPIDQSAEIARLQGKLDAIAVEMSTLDSANAVEDTTRANIHAILAA